MRISDWSSDVCSSDLSIALRARSRADAEPRRFHRAALCGSYGPKGVSAFVVAVRSSAAPRAGAAARSEEHTSELQSLMRISYAVFCLKKKKQKQDGNNVKYNTNNALTLNRISDAQIIHRPQRREIDSI